MENQCWNCKKNQIKYIQLDSMILTRCLCQECYQKLENDKKKGYQSMDFFHTVSKEKLKQNLPNTSSLITILKDKEIENQQNKILLKYDHLEEINQKLNNFYESSQIKDYQCLNRNQINEIFEKNENDKKMNDQIQKILNQDDVFDFDEEQFTKNKEIFLSKLGNYNPFFRFKQLGVQKMQDYNGLYNQLIDNLPLIVQIGGQIEDMKDQTNQETNYFGYRNDKQQKHGIGFFFLDSQNDKHQISQQFNELNKLTGYFGVFKEDNFLYGLKLIQISNEQYKLYNGYFQQDKIIGKGWMEAKEKGELHRYNGNFSKGQRHGKGKYNWEIGNIKYEYDGEWENDLFNGEGIYKTKNYKIKGQFKAGYPLNEDIYDSNGQILKTQKEQQQFPKQPQQIQFQQQPQFSYQKQFPQQIQLPMQTQQQQQIFTTSKQFNNQQPNFQNQQYTRIQTQKK